jgi:hypothetical protein
MTKSVLVVVTPTVPIRHENAQQVERPVVLVKPAVAPTVERPAKRDHAEAALAALHASPLRPNVRRVDRHVLRGVTLAVRARSPLTAFCCELEAAKPFPRFSVDAFRLMGWPRRTRGRSPRVSRSAARHGRGRRRGGASSSPPSPARGPDRRVELAPQAGPLRVRVAVLVRLVGHPRRAEVALELAHRVLQHPPLRPAREDDPAARIDDRQRLAHLVVGALPPAPELANIVQGGWAMTPWIGRLGSFSRRTSWPCSRSTRITS